MSEYQPNSHRSKDEADPTAEERKVQKVVSGKAKTKKNEIRKLTDIFIAENYYFSSIFLSFSRFFSALTNKS